MKDLKYTAAYTVPFFTILGLYLGDIYSFTNVIYVFGLVPILDYFGPNSTTNLGPNAKDSNLKKKIFDWLLYLNLPILYGTIGYAIYIFNTRELSTVSWSGNIFSLGIMIGVCGINVAHELGHRKSKAENRIAQILLLPALYIHFFIEHNRGHHKNVATKQDAATAQKGENVYFFWFKSLIGSYINAWRLESKKLKNNNLSIFSLKNQMIQFSFVQLIYIGVIFLICYQNIDSFWAIIGSGFVGALLLETINYVEHYGLQRKLLPSGRYEKVQPKHSWNANFHFGRIILYELTRHSDHHYIASKKYQVLEHHQSSPQLPYGYPMSMLISFVPPLWFWIMHPLLNKINQ